MAYVLSTIDSEATNNEVSPLLPHSASQSRGNWSRNSTAENVDNDNTIENVQEDNDDLSQGTESRKKLERTLLRKVDTRMSILVLIYILNCEFISW